MPKTTIPIANGFYESGSLPISAQQCINMYPVIEDAPSLSQETLRQTPGAVQVATSGIIGQINRGAWTLDGVPYFVNGTKLYRLNRTVVDDADTFSLTEIGTIEGSARVSMADNGTQLFILVPGGKGYVFTASPDTLTEITDPDFTANGNPQFVVFIDGYFVCSTDSKKFIASDLNNGLSWDALQFGSAEADPDDIVAPIVFKNQLFIAGSQTFETFQNVGGADFPFQRSGLYLDKGVSAPYTLVKASNTFMFIGAGENESPAVWAYAGNDLQKISTKAIDVELQKLTPEELDSSFAYQYGQDGAFFVAFSLPSTTFVFDTTSSRWHERKSQIITAGVSQTVRSRVNSLTTAYGYTFVGDSQDGRIGYLSVDTYTEYEGDIIRDVVAQPLQNQMDSFLMPDAELTIESGVGNSDSSDPIIRMSISRDGGKTFSDERQRRMGKIGEYTRRAIWRRNGRIPRFAVLRFVTSEPVKVVFIQLTITVI